MSRLFKNRYSEIRSGWVVVSVLALIIISLGAVDALVPEIGGDVSILMMLGITLLYGSISIGGGLLLF